VKQQFARIRHRLAKHFSAVEAAAELISRSPRSGLRLLRDSRTAHHTQPQPDVYPFAAYLAERFDCTHAVLFGQPTAKDLIQLYPRFAITGFVPDVERYRHRYGFGTWYPNSPQAVSLPDNILARAVIICTGVIEQLETPTQLFANLRLWLDRSPVCILTTSDRSFNDQNEREPSLAAGKWNQMELELLLKAEGFNVEFSGLTASDSNGYEKKTILAVITRNSTAKLLHLSAPADFRVVAFMAAYNEEDIIVQSIEKWTDQGVRVHVLENWSSDATYDLAKQLESRLPVTVERFPRSGPSPYFDWGAMLARIEELSSEIEADWFVRRGADEVLTSPWPGVSYRDGLYFVDRAGFNCVDHTIIEFHPVDEGFEAGMDHEAYFKYFDFKHLSHRFQRKAWKNSGQPISTIPSAGHDVIFEGRRVYPFKFLLKHYSFRSQKHGEKKVFKERKARWNPSERARGWHVHYDSMQAGHRFLRSTTEKEFFDEENFNRTYLVERLSGIGVDR
jgi:glycosyltransferase involved in cell wall biosynthesis